MNALFSRSLAGLLVLVSVSALANTRYVDLNSPGPTAPYTSWVTAATNIQDAVDAAVAGDVVLVTNGVYRAGGRIVYGSLTNRVGITNQIIVRSVNGPRLTAIEGKPDSGDGNGVRCVFLGDGAILTGFTLTNGSTTLGDAGFDNAVGGGVQCETFSATVSNCILVANSAIEGGGAFGGTLINCLLFDNHADAQGGGASQNSLENCTLVNNEAGGTGAGVKYGTLNNCIVYDNAPENYSDSTLNYCCTIPLPASGIGNIANTPNFVDAANNDFQMQSNSHCINAGKNALVNSTTDLDGSSRIVDGTVDLGAFEYQSVRPRWIRYVDLNSSSPTPPFTNWATAAVSIQDAIDEAYSGDLVLVTNGIYQTGGRTVYETLTNRVAVNKRLAVESVNGPEFTIIKGYQMPGVVHGDDAIRCVYLTENTMLAGFTLTNGATRTSGDFETQMYGGGVWCESSSAILSNCVIIGNAASSAGGAYRGTLTQCVVANNTAGDAGGGAFVSELNHCLITNNVAGSYGGGAYGTLRNCIITHNTARYSAGANGYMLSCTIVSNTATTRGGGVEESDLFNCIVYYNSAPNGPDTSSSGLYCCCTPTDGTGVVTNPPLFVNAATGNFRLQANSPCINAGQNNYASTSTDLDGNSRIVGGTVDIGAFEFPAPTSLLSYAWAQQHGLTTDGSADFTDPDGDGMKNYGEWRSDTNPTNSLSVLRLLTVTNSTLGATVTWSSAATRSYWLERASNFGLAIPFQIIATNISGMAGTTSFTDSGATNGNSYYYRVGVY